MHKRILSSFAGAAIGFGRWYFSPKTKPGFYLRLALTAAVLANPIANFLTVRTTAPTALVRVPADPPMGIVEIPVANAGEPLTEMESRYLQDLTSTKIGSDMAGTWADLSRMKDGLSKPFNDSVTRSIRVGCDPVRFPGGSETTAVETYRAAVASAKINCRLYPVRQTD